MAAKRDSAFGLFLLLVLLKTTDAGLISQSSIQSCDWGDSNDPTSQDGAGCKEKLVVSMTLQSGQVGQLSVHVLIGTSSAPVLSRRVKQRLSMQTSIKYIYLQMLDPAH